MIILVKCVSFEGMVRRVIGIWTLSFDILHLHLRQIQSVCEKSLWLSWADFGEINSLSLLSFVIFLLLCWFGACWNQSCVCLHVLWSGVMCGSFFCTMRKPRRPIGWSHALLFFCPQSVQHLRTSHFPLILSTQIARYHRPSSQVSRLVLISHVKTLSCGSVMSATESELFLLMM